MSRPRGRLRPVRQASSHLAHSSTVPACSPCCRRRVSVFCSHPAHSSTVPACDQLLPARGLRRNFAAGCGRQACAACAWAWSRWDPDCVHSWGGDAATGKHARLGQARLLTQPAEAVAAGSRRLLCACDWVRMLHGTGAAGVSLVGVRPLCVHTSWLLCRIRLLCPAALLHTGNSELTRGPVYRRASALVHNDAVPSTGGLRQAG